MSDVDELPSMWYCPTCQSWLGTKIEVCFECGNPRPRWPLLEDDVDVNDSRDVTLADRVRSKVRRVCGR